MDKILTINCDGGSRGNPGPAASSFVATLGGKEIFSSGKYLGLTTNNVAEYSAVLMAMEWLKENQEIYKDHVVVFILDSQLVAMQLTGVYKIKNENLKTLADKIKTIQKELGFTISFKHVLREKNVTADFLVNKTLDENF